MSGIEVGSKAAMRQDYPYLEDVMVETHTHRSDWLVGAGEVATYLGRPDERSAISQDLAGKRFPNVIQVAAIVQTNVPYNWAWRKSDADAWIEGHKKVSVSPAESNGHSKPSERDVVILKEGTPVLARGDADKIAQSLWDLRTAAIAQTKAIDSLSSSVDANTKAVRDHIKEMKDFFGPSGSKPA